MTISDNYFGILPSLFQTGMGRGQGVGLVAISTLNLDAIALISLAQWRRA